MSLKTKFLSIAALAISTTAFSTFVSAQDTPANSSDSVQTQEKVERKAYGKRGGYGKGMHGGRHHGMRALRGIDLTDAQKEQLRVIHEANRPDDSIRQEVRTLALAKRDGTITADQQERLKALKLQAREKGQVVQQQILAVLTPEQRQQLETRKEEMRQKMQERRELRRQNKTNDNPMDN